MAKDKHIKKHSHAHVEPAHAAGHAAPADDAPPSAKPDAAAATFAAVSAAAASALATPEFVTLRFPWPADAPADVLKQASIVVRAKSERGRRRAGFVFTRGETVIPYSDLDAAQLALLTGDAGLIVSLRVPKPD